MPEREDVLTVVREWVLKAENDLKNAAHTLLLASQTSSTPRTFAFSATDQCTMSLLRPHEMRRRDESWRGLAIE
jgi:hypothetical protein